jgi:hypothetical protein
VWGLGVPKTCPGSVTNIPLFANDTGVFFPKHSHYDTKIPQSKVDLFSSGLSAFGRSVCSAFDIQYRVWSWENPTDDNLVYDNGSAYAVGDYRYVSNVALGGKLDVVEGLVVDAVNGEIGFRNHSAPPPSAYGSTWTEDLLFICPVTQCVSTNLTLDFSLPSNTSTSNYSAGEIVDLRLTDRGGFAELNLSYSRDPSWDLIHPDTQRNPELWRRAYTAAWLHNVYLMAFMNVTNMRNLSDPRSRPFQYLNSSLGKSFKLGKALLNKPSPGSIQFAGFHHFIYGVDTATNSTHDPITNITSPGTPALYPNLFGISSLNGSDIGRFNIIFHELHAYRTKRC